MNIYVVQPLHVTIRDLPPTMIVYSILSKTAGQRVTAEPRSGRLPTYADT